MDDAIRLGFAVVLMLLTLSVAIGFMAVPLMFLRKAGALRVVRWLSRKSWRGVLGLLRFLTSRRRRRVRRLPAGASMRLFK
jgi:hypothetical protein